VRYHFKVHKEGAGYWAQCIEYDGCLTQGDGRDELDHNMQEALDLILDDPPESTWIPPMPDPSIKGRNIVEVEVDPRIALAMLIRVNRLKQGLTQREAATRLGMKHVYQYQKLESSKTSNPELGTLVKLKRLFPDFSVDLALA
jgi:antitoxin HicB